MECGRSQTHVLLPFLVRYALSRSLSPMLVADYQLHLPDKTLLENKLRELQELADTEEVPLDE